MYKWDYSTASAFRLLIRALRSKWVVAQNLSMTGNQNIFQCVSRSKSNDSLGHLLLPLRRKEELFCFVRFSCDKVMPFILTSVITINDLIHHHGEYLTKVKTVLSNQSRRQQVSEAIILLIALENCKKIPWVVDLKMSSIYVCIWWIWFF